MTGAGRPRTPWRVLLYIALFMALLWLEGLLFPFISGLELPEDRLSIGLVAQTTLVLTAALGAAWVMLRWVDRRPLRSLGFPLTGAGARELGIGVAAGTAALAGVVAVFALLGWYRYAPEPGSLGGWATTSGAALLALAIPAASEEALLRGYLFRTIREGAGGWVAVLFTSVVFAMLHGGNPGAGTFELVNIFLAGVLLAVAVLRTGTLWLATGVHLGWNWVMSGPLDLPVSGLQGLDVPLYDAVAVGPAWLTGGDFGPEGGLVGTLGVCAGIVLVIWLTRPGAVLAGAEE
ncbi:MAG: CPBP family intramembrane glutamic endopeptidase [Candidatus Longimicrobiales bacterium M2_2A_002]